MNITSQMIKDAAAEAGVCEVGVANIERFAGAPRQMHPKNIFPDCKSVVVVLSPIPRGTYRGITEGTHWPNYTFYSYNRLNELFRPRVTYKTACFIEDHGFEAVPVFPGVSERPIPNSRITPDRPLRDVNVQVRIAGVAAGLGEIGWSKVFLSPKYGPRVRLGCILTDAELEPDPLIPPGTLCNRCMKCVKDCPGNAIPRMGEKDTIKIKIDDTEYEWGDVHMGRCTLTHHGQNWKASPFLRKDFPGYDLDVQNTTMSEELAYRLTYGVALSNRPASEEFPYTSLCEYYKQIMDHCGYFAICGAKGCIRACVDSLEARGCIEQDTFGQKVLPRESRWELSSPKQDDTGGVAERKFPEEFTNPDPNPGNW
jgi:epoxyqueuosine reductase